MEESGLEKLYEDQDRRRLSQIRREERQLKLRSRKHSEVGRILGRR